MKCSHYYIVRYFRQAGKASRKVSAYRNLTLDEARAHCSRLDTMKAGEWFNGFTRSCNCDRGA